MKNIARKCFWIRWNEWIAKKIDKLNIGVNNLLEEIDNKINEIVAINMVLGQHFCFCGCHFHHNLVQKVLFKNINLF
jgi:hypothetical protein